MPKLINGVWLPDREDYLIREIEIGPYFAGAGTVQFKKFAAAVPHIRNFGHAVDIGANAGLWTRVMARCFPLVTCFEPQSECHEPFWLNNPTAKMDERSQVVLHAYALDNAAGIVRLDTSGRSTGFAHLGGKGVQIEARTLDSFELQDVDFIKIDVEGWEYPVVQGGADTIRRWKPTMVLEQKPGNAERFGMKQFAAIDLLKKWGAAEMINMGGDVVMAWRGK